MRFCVGDAKVDSAIVAVYTVEDVTSLQFELRKAENMEWIAEGGNDRARRRSWTGLSC